MVLCGRYLYTVPETKIFKPIDGTETAILLMYLIYTCTVWATIFKLEKEFYAYQVIYLHEIATLLSFIISQKGIE